uniref:Uncharacterized protein n=1 Tax=Setaria viridis TaxID=4556 RepID=A0A4U6W7B3_SETVI|nr:hypothetical protein SEVIR_1G109066v2 [Setaria viridis]
MEVLPRGWDNSIGHNAMLEGQLEGLSRCLERLDQTNCRLRDESNAAPDAFKDAEKIAMFEAKIVQMEEALHLRDKLIDKKNAQLRDKDELVGNLNTVLATKDGAISQVHHRLHCNCDNIVHLSSQCYRDRDMVERLQAAWERSDRRRRMELEELSAWIPVKYRKEPWEETPPALRGPQAWEWKP